MLGGNQRHAAADVHDAIERARSRETGDGRTNAGFPAGERSGDRRFFELPGQKKDSPLHPASARRTGRHLADGAGRRGSRPGISEVHRVLSLPGRVSRAARPPSPRAVCGTAATRSRGTARDAPFGYSRSH